jgi:hypothetical protein
VLEILEPAAVMVSAGMGHRNPRAAVALSRDKGDPGAQ